MALGARGGAAQRRAAVVGTGLVGGSVGLALRSAGWHVSGVDRDAACARRALELGAIDEIGEDPDADLTVVATPVGSIVEEVRRALSRGSGMVTDVGSVKAPMVELMASPRYVGGHPMAGSELEGVEGARADLFDGASWVLTPVPGTDDDTYAELSAVVTSFGAQVVALPPDRHDAIVALVSHVPHLTAATLMRLAAERSEEHRALLQLAAGGFRDMTRVAAGHPGIWPDICAENRDAIVATLDMLVDGLLEVRGLVSGGDREGLLDLLSRARASRIALPARFAAPDLLDELRVPVPDKAGVLAEITTLATDLGVSIADIEIAHSVEGDTGVLILLVEAAVSAHFVEALVAAGYRPSTRALG